MKTLFTILILLLFFKNSNAQFITIPDPNFVNWLQTKIPTAMSGNQMDTTHILVTNRVAINVESVGISNLNGLQYFDQLDSLNCIGNLLVSLPTLPANLKYLQCKSNSLNSLPILPNSLTIIDCGYNQLNSLPALPSSLISLACVQNSLTALPSLPSSLLQLDCSSNPITNLPALPSLWNLSCEFCQLTSLPALPNSLYSIHCGWNQISYIPNFGTSLLYFYGYYNQLSSLPPLPNSLLWLWVSDNQLTSLPSIPNSLTNLLCGNNQLTNLPALSNSLVYLDCGNNLLTSLPPLITTTLTSLYCDTNFLVTLPPLPLSLTGIMCNQNLLTSLPTLPNSLNFLLCQNNHINCFAPFSNSLGIQIDNNPFTCLPNYTPSMDAATLAYPLCGAGNINGCNYAEGIVGYTYNDINSNCIKNQTDSALKNIPIHIYGATNNLLAQTYTALNGVYGFQQSSGTYTVKIDTVNMPFSASCIYPGLDSTLTVASLDTNINFALACKPGFDIGIQSSTPVGPIFPGLTHTINIVAGDMSHWYNLKCASGISGIFSFSVNGPVTYISPAPGALSPNVSGNMYTYTISDFGAINISNDFKLIFQTDTTAQSTDSICISAIISPSSGDNNLINNTYSFCYRVTNSYDPNIKEVYPIDVQPGFNDWLTYTIHFQNTGNAPAYNIRLADTLDNMLDLKTFQVINYSHYNQTNLIGNILNIRFPNIQLPDSSSNASGSIGFIQYRIKPKATWAAPYKIKNTAYIYFDYNTPIVTNTTYNSIVIDIGIKELYEKSVLIYPNPTNGSFTIELNNKEKQFIKLFDITGNIVLSQTIENGQGNIDASNLAAGVYTINIKGNSTVINKKVVIVK